MFAYKIQDKKIALTVEIIDAQSDTYKQQGYVISDQSYVVANTEYDGTKWIDTTPAPVTQPVYVAPVPTTEEIATQRKQSLDSLYKSKRTEYIYDYGAASMYKDAGNASIYANDCMSLDGIYGNYSAEITAGNDPFVLYGNDAFMLTGNGVFY